MTLGTEILSSPTQDLNASESVWFYTRPANASVQLGDNYYTFLIVKHNIEGYCYVELGIGETTIDISDNHDQWNIKMTSINTSSHDLCIAQVNITFDDTTLKGISTNLIDVNRTSISIQYRFRFYIRGDPFDSSSSMAFIDIKKSDNYDSAESGSGVDDNGTHNDSSERGNATTGSTQEHANSHMPINEDLFNAVSSSFQLGIVTELLIISSLIVLSFSVV